MDWECAEPTAEEVAEARRLYEDGWVAISNKYRHVGRVSLPPFTDVVRSARLPAWASDALRQCYDRISGEDGARVHGATRSLSPGTYKAFKSIGRRVRDGGAS